MSLSGKNCVVSGGARGIGAQIVKDLAAQGANVLTCYATDSSKPAAEELVEEAKKGKGGRVYAVQLDVAAADCGPKFLAEAKRCFGDDFKLHILVHNAGVSINASLQDITLEGYTKQMDINVRAPLFITQAFQPYLAKQDNGRVILISSISARLGQATKGVYSASKLALESFVMCWANEFGKEDGITVNALEPGPVETDMWNSNTDEFKATFDSKLVASTKEISDLVLMLCDPRSRWCNGSILNANGGIFNFI